MVKWLGIGIGLVLVVVGGRYYFSLRETASQSDHDLSPGSGRYVEYSSEAFAEATDARRVLYFFAPWCSTCRPTDAEFTAQADQIPPNVILFRVNYDTETKLKQKYNITYQHTFVQVSKNGDEVAKWNGGGMVDLLANLKP